MFRFSEARTRRRISLTPMIDVVFLLLVFFMLAARFGQDGVLTLGAAGGAADWHGPPRLVEIGPALVRLNGVPVAEAGLAEALAPLTGDPADPVILRAVDGAGVQRLVDVTGLLSDAGFTSLMLAQ